MKNAPLPSVFNERLKVRRRQLANRQRYRQETRPTNRAKKTKRYRARSQVVRAPSDDRQTRRQENRRKRRAYHADKQNRRVAA